MKKVVGPYVPTTFIFYLKVYLKDRRNQCTVFLSRLMIRIVQFSFAYLFFFKRKVSGPYVPTTFFFYN